MNTPARFAVALLLLAQASPAVADATRAASAWTEDYDEDFQKYSQRYFGLSHDWRWFKAQAIAESTLDPLARSKYGALGLMQLMPATFAEIRQKNPEFIDMRINRWNIAAGIWYDRQLYLTQTWRSFADPDRLLISFAAYNAGLGTALDAFDEVPAPVKGWPDVAPHLPDGPRSYVERIVTLKRVLPRQSHDPRHRGYSRRFSDFPVWP